MFDFKRFAKNDFFTALVIFLRSGLRSREIKKEFTIECFEDTKLLQKSSLIADTKVGVAKTNTKKRTWKERTWKLLIAKLSSDLT